MPSTPTELTHLGVRELADLIRSHAVSADEVIRSHLARIEATDAALGAFILVRRDAPTRRPRATAQLAPYMAFPSA